MNTIENLVDEYGIEEKTAQMMLENYKKRVGMRHGDFEIVDVNFVGDARREVALKCTFCGRKEFRVTKDWDHIRKRKCVCRKERVEKAKEAENQRKKAEKNSVLQKEIGNIYGEYVVVGLTGGKYQLRCVECGAVREILAQNLANGVWSDRVCHVHRKTEEKFTEEYIGRKNNMLTVVGITHDSSTGKKRFVCKCDCGKMKSVKPTLWENGRQISCGCYQIYRSVYTDTDQRIKGIWRGMKSRCERPTDKSWPQYGGRGITICKEWADFKTFLKWSYANGYENTRTIDRIDPNGNYEPSNCRWATWEVQNVNHRPRTGCNHG